MKNLANYLCLMFCLCLAILLPEHTYAQGANSLAGQRFQLQDEVTVLSAMKDYNDTVLQLKRLDATERVKECSFAGVKTYRCTRESPSGFFYLPPFPSALPYNVPKNPGYVPSFSWAPVKEALEGSKVVAQWKDLANAGTLFDCNGPTCWTIIYGFSHSEKSEENALALCRVYLVGKIVGGPENCSSIAIFAPDNTWIKIVMGYISVLDAPSGAGVRDPDLRITILSSHLPAIAEVLTAVKNLLTTEPLKLLADFYPTSVHPTGVIGVAEPGRISPVLDGWRERATIRIDAVSDNQAPPASLNLDIWWMELYVNKQNTALNSDWHALTTQQIDAYNRTVRKSLKKHLPSLCKTSEWRDDSSLKCD